MTLDTWLDCLLRLFHRPQPVLWLPSAYALKGDGHDHLRYIVCGKSSLWSAPRDDLCHVPGECQQLQELASTASSCDGFMSRVQQEHILQQLADFASRVNYQSVAENGQSMHMDMQVASPLLTLTQLARSSNTEVTRNQAQMQGVLAASSTVTSLLLRSNSSLMPASTSSFSTSTCLVCSAACSTFKAASSITCKDMACLSHLAQLQHGNAYCQHWLLCPPCVHY